MRKQKRLGLRDYCSLLLAMPVSLGAGAAHAADAPPSPATPPAETAGAKPTTPTDMMRAAHEAMLVGDNERAIRIYLAVLAIPNHPHLQEAQEMLGVARERNGQLAHAKAEYETYLKLYPEGEGAERVRQRLFGLVTQRELTPEPLRKAAVEKGVEWQHFGSVSESYRWDQTSDGGVTATGQSALITDLDYGARRRGSSYDIRTRVTGSYRHDFDGRLDGDTGRLRNLYVEALSTGDGFSGSLGRQTRNDSGILGRFDGAILSKGVFGNSRINLVGGKPVEYGSDDRLNPHKEFYGLSLDRSGLAGAWDLNAFFISQSVDGIKDREAIGGQLRYAKAGTTFFTLADYDTSFATLDTLLAMASLARADGTVYSVILDYRTGPLLSTSNALIGRSESSIKELLATLSESEIRQLAQDRTALTRTVTVAASRPLTPKLQLMGDITFSSMDGTPASGGVAATEASGTDSFYSAQLVASDLLKPGDVGIFGMRFSDTSTATTTSLSANYRRVLNQQIYFNPKLRLDLRQSASNGDDTVIAAALLVSRELRRDLSVEGELGAEFGNREVVSGSGEHSLYSLYLGVRKDF